MKPIHLIAVFSILASYLVFVNHAMAQENSIIIKHSDDFEVNGQGDNDNWNLTSWLSLPQRNVEGANYETRIKTLYSATGIYFLFDCQDSQITSTLKEDFADLWEEDVVEVFLWTDEDYPFYFEYELSPANYELPILVPNVKGDFLGWRPWHYDGERKTRHATSIQRQGEQVTAWIAEFFIPFALLEPMAKVPPIPGTRWRANMYRVDYDAGVSSWAWQPIRGTFHDIERFGTIIFE
jgi:hypothetical protein